MLGTLHWRGRSYIAANEVPVLPEHIVAVGLLTREDVRLLGPTFQRLWPVEDTPCFSQLLQVIDSADRELHRLADKERLDEAMDSLRSSGNASSAAPGEPKT